MNCYACGCDYTVCSDKTHVLKSKIKKLEKIATTLSNMQWSFEHDEAVDALLELLEAEKEGVE